MLRKITDGKSLDIFEENVSAGVSFRKLQAYNVQTITLI